MRNEVITVNNCSWYLWLGGRKIFNIRQLRENFDTALLTGYFLGGSLTKWLSDLGEYSILKRLSTIDLNGDIGNQLEFAFGVSPDRKPQEQEAPAPEQPDTAETPDTAVIPVIAGSSFNGTGSFYGLAENSAAGILPGSFTGTPPGSFGGSVSAAPAGSYKGLAESSFAYIVGNALAARFTSSFGFGSYSSFVSGQALNIASSAFGGSGSSFALMIGRNLFGAEVSGSFAGSSFSIGSFGYYLGKYGQFTFGSGGSFYGSFGLYLLSLLMSAGSSSGSPGSFGNIGMFFGEGSFRYSAAGVTITAEEYRRTLINLSSCPLNAYGYGINLV